ncbi:polysaccharide deacetylase family protein [Peribacillus frigoritolerans]|uniref:polysaccharide deacetylase family protein n=1 Tax=Peribacillus frigoritolerans TaxID=450367 RepID=UPI00399CE720
MSLAQCLQLQSEGWEIASHTVNHLNLATLTLEESDFILSESIRKLIELGFKVDNFVHPNGGYNNNIMKLTKNYRLLME